jgi:flagellar assembly factor FliW
MRGHEALKVDTTRFGPIIVDEQKIITMPSGMLGFPDKKRYAIVQHKENSPFFWYQSVDDPALAFVITSPFFFVRDYSVPLDDAIKQMSWDDENIEEKVELYVVVNIPNGSPNKMTANLIGPILINTDTFQALQMVVTDSPYSHKFPLLKDN